MGTNWKKAAATAFASVALAVPVAPAMGSTTIPAPPPGDSHVVPAPVPGPLQRPEVQTPELQKPDGRKPEVQKPDGRKPEEQKPDGREPLVPPGLDTERQPDGPEIEVPPTKAKLSAPSEVCTGENVTLDASGSTGLGLTYTFAYEGHSKPNGSGSSVSVPLNGPGNVPVSVTVTGAGGSDTASKTVQVKFLDCSAETGTSGDIPGPPSVTLDVVPAEGCGPLKVDMTATGTADTERYDAIAGYEFSYEGHTVPTSTATTHTATLNGPGDMTVTVKLTTTSGQTATASKTVKVLAADDPECDEPDPDEVPDANARGDYLVTCDAVTVNFTGEGSTGTDPLTYAWDFDGNGTTDATGINVTHTYGVGTHHARMTLTDGNGKTDTTQLDELVVQQCPTSDPATPVYYEPNFAG